MKIQAILKKVADENNVSVNEVREEIQKAIDSAWLNPPNDGGITITHQQKVPCKDKIPTPEELICYLAEELSHYRI